MDRFVLNVFKGIMISMIMIFAFDLLSYLYRAMSLDQRMLNIMTGMQRVVMENNYLPDESLNQYAEIFTSMADDFNGGKAVKITGSQSTNYESNIFVSKISLNYEDDAIGDFSHITNCNCKLNTPGEYGDVIVVQAQVAIKQPMWGFNNQRNTTAGGELSMSNFNREGYGENILTYTYLVPCLHYQRI